MRRVGLGVLLELGLKGSEKERWLCNEGESGNIGGEGVYREYSWESIGKVGEMVMWEKEVVLIVIWLYWRVGMYKEEGRKWEKGILVWIVVKVLGWGGIEEVIRSWVVEGEGEEGIGKREEEYEKWLGGLLEIILVVYICSRKKKGENIGSNWVIGGEIYGGIIRKGVVLKGRR